VHQIYDCNARGAQQMTQLGSRASLSVGLLSGFRVDANFEEDVKSYLIRHRGRRRQDIAYAGERGVFERVCKSGSGGCPLQPTRAAQFCWWILRSHTAGWRTS
jgi:hypothetical protein